MADEITGGCYLAFASGTIAVHFPWTTFTDDLSGSALYFRGTGSVGTSEAALELGTVTDPGWCIMKNTHASATVSVRPASGGTDLITVPAGCVSGPFKFHASVSAPYVIGSAASTTYEYLLIQA